ncbi:ABC transporter ATP-binding protein [Bacillus licheniformis]
MITYFLKSFHLIFKTNKLWIFGSLFIRILNGLFPVCELWILTRLVNETASIIIDKKDNVLTLVFLLFIQLIIMISRSSCVHIMNVLDKDMELKLNLKLGNMIIEKSLNSPFFYFDMPEFYNHQFRINNYGHSFLRPISNSMHVLQLCITIVSYIGFLFFIHWGLVVLGILASIPAFIIQYKFGYSNFNLNRLQSGLMREASYINSLFRNKQSIKEIKLFRSGNFLINRWRKLTTSNNKKILKLFLKQNWANIGLDSLTAVLYSMSAVLMVWLLKLGKMNIGSFVSTAQAIQGLQGTVNQTSHLLASLFESNLYIKDFFDFIEYQNEDDAKKEKLEKNIANKSDTANISLKHVYFKYPLSNGYSLKDINLEIKDKEKVAIVGHNGSGKTTLIQLIIGLYKPTAGNIFLEGKDLCQIDENELSEYVSVVFQDFVRYALSVKENIALSDISQIDNLNEIKQTAFLSGADSFIEALPNGYDTTLGKVLPNSIDISGGQWQRIALARSIFKKSKLIILDEPTAALDPKTEAYVFEKFRELTENKTAIFISHRLASVKMADRIIHLKDGQILEEGSHKELMALKGEYYNMYMTQAKWFDGQREEVIS